uniref:Uncharacterized protein n=1 Tax=Pseudomonas fluorescens (strain SBW25) TaxID=216595 RepID=A0A0G4E4M9_PSEFS|nr:hypothetical protein [Pseudomonas fluorescens]CEK42119.1 hypothetical protein PQBR57_0166 [Pseudomonas fluorescens SBW25]
MVDAKKIGTVVQIAVQKAVDPKGYSACFETIQELMRGNSMKRWDVYQDGEWVDGVQGRDHSEAVLEALRKLDRDDDAGLDVRLASQ